MASNTPQEQAREWLVSMEVPPFEQVHHLLKVQGIENLRALNEEARLKLAEMKKSYAPRHNTGEKMQEIVEADPDDDALMLKLAREFRTMVLENRAISAPEIALAEARKRLQGKKGIIEAVLKELELDMKGTKERAMQARALKRKEELRLAELEALTARTEAETAEYAALLALGKKKQTIQQAHAAGDFIPVDESSLVYLPSSTGKRLGARG